MTLIPLERMQLERVLFEAGVLPLFCNPSATRVISPPPCPPPPTTIPPRRAPDIMQKGKSPERVGCANAETRCRGVRHPGNPRQRLMQAACHGKSVSWCRGARVPDFRDLDARRPELNRAFRKCSRLFLPCTRLLPRLL
jgi:hypothetical protein